MVTNINTPGASRWLAPALSCFFLSHLLTNSASAALEEVIVTASKRSESLQDVAMSVNAFTAADIEEAGISDAEDVAVLTPSLSIVANVSPFTAAIIIRGIGTSQSDIALEPSVGLFVDDVYLERSGLGMSDLTDIERIEILRGPQGSLYGKNTNAGAINIVTKKPNFEAFEGYAQAELGNYALQKFTVAASGPVTEQVAYRLSASSNKRDGYLENNAGEDMNGADDWNVIGKLQWHPSDDLSLLLNASHIDRDVNCCGADVVQTQLINDQLVARGFAPDANDPFDYKISANVPSTFENESDTASLVVDYQRSWGSIKSITAWNDYTTNRAQDVDRTPLDVFFQTNAINDGESVSQELRFTSDTGDSIDYQIGVFYYQSKTIGGDGGPFTVVGEEFVDVSSDVEELQALLPPGIPLPFVAVAGDSISADVTLETENLAIFGQSTWHISDEWRLTGGLRWTDEKKDADILVSVNSSAISAALTGESLLTRVTTPIDQAFSRSTDDVNWLLNTSYDLAQDVMVFASVATGSKSGGFNTVNGVALEREFDDESTISYELGVKSMLLDDRLRLNAALFYSEIDDFQFQEQLETGIGTRVTNRAEIETSGLDLEFQANPIPNLTLHGGLLYMHDYDITAGPEAGQQLKFTAEISGNVGATLFFPIADGGIYLRTDYSFMSDHITNTNADVRAQDEQDRNLLNARIGFRNDQWHVALWGKNLTEDEYAPLTAATLPLTGVDAYFLAPPRTYGATLRYDF
ncbi:MAG: TonB-dependent receptor [Halioglobus sp.]